MKLVETDLDIQGSAKEWALGCVIPATWPPPAAGAHFTQPKNYSLAEPCTVPVGYSDTLWELHNCLRVTDSVILVSIREFLCIVKSAEQTLKQYFFHFWHHRTTDSEYYAVGNGSSSSLSLRV